MNAIRKGDTGTVVKKWQNFLFGIGYTTVIADGDFGEKTEIATIDFQKSHGLTPDGVVGNSTCGKAMQFGFPLVEDPENDAMSGPNWPPPPNFKPLTPAQVQAQFGKIEYKVNPDRTITITNDWQQKNIIAVKIPQLEKLPPYYHKNYYFHKKVAAQFQEFFSAVEKAGLADRLLTFDGEFNPRLIKGSENLSNHSFGTGIDINAQWNGLGTIPALVGKKGSVRELVPIAHKLGLYWGGHFGRKDGMHFEVAKVL